MIHKTLSLISICLLLGFTAAAQDPAAISRFPIAEAKAFLKKKNMDTSICILVDMRIHSGKNRLFVWDFKKKEVVIAGLCAHGVGGGSTANKPVFSNAIGSNCTSPGKYRIGKRGYSNWGIHVNYKMHGLEKSNDNAYKRIVVLHSYSPVPDHEIYPATLFGQSAGCPVLADAVMRKVDQLLKKKSKPVLLWIYN
ncbi:murein L,D-transpeptidase catalytic domain-containing protein [Pedobacter caeni]|uniref:L,D-transpeptidase catalytic domain n=1 Tax=Pedobacter caeni TaxID=288992 RepID=A0A1M5B519_9SPHI|nr:murein L,D-transpeptidase catalytic domain family protein [Pedobacter caeni]SHF37651.1 L,D-transpeptidase catalytic domain [Pedobacter caeni]